MSTKQSPAKTPAKAPAAKAAAKAPPKAAPKPAPKPAPPAEEPAAAAADAADAAPEGESPKADGKKSRVQLATVLEINISQARCATHLKQSLGDEQIEAEIKALRAELKAAKDAKDSAKADALKKQIADLSKSIVRMSSETPIATATVMDDLVKEHIRHGMDMAIASERKIVEVAHFHDGAPESLVYFPIFNKLPTFAGYNPENEEELRKKRAAENKAAKEAREAKKAAEDKKNPARGAKAAAKGGAKADEDEEEDDAPSEHTKTTFFTYVENAIKTVKKDEPYRTMRVSNRVREYLSDLLAEVVNRLSRLSRIIVQEVVGVRTMNADHIKAVLHVLMADEGRSDEQIAEVKQQIDAKLALYHEHLKSEREKKASSLAVEKKAELERKRLGAELARKKKQADLAKKRSLEAAAKAESLAAESAKLAQAQGAAPPADAATAPAAGPGAPAEAAVSI